MKINIETQRKEYESSSLNMLQHTPYRLKGGDDSVIFFKSGVYIISISDNSIPMSVEIHTSIKFSKKRFILMDDMEIEINVKRKTD